jgi:2,3-bisphosphoglycerate-independent phosphoglycerate mutase
MAMGGIEGHLDDSVICITGDHSTPCVMKDHSGDPVPIVFTTSGIRKDSVRFFDEISCARGSYNIMSGDVLRILQQLSDRSEKYGA